MNDEYKRLEKRFNVLEKEVKLVIEAQKKFYPKFDKLLSELIKAFNKLNESATTMGSMAGIFGNLFEENKDSINQIANQLAKTMEKESVEQEKVLSTINNT